MPKYVILLLIKRIKLQKTLHIPQFDCTHSNWMINDMFLFDYVFFHSRHLELSQYQKHQAVTEQTKSENEIQVSLTV